jgi:hypothetical protein
MAKLNAVSEGCRSRVLAMMWPTPMNASAMDCPMQAVAHGGVEESDGYGGGKSSADKRETRP